MGVAAPAAGTPDGTPGVYSNINYLLLCQLLERVTGTKAEKCIKMSVAVNLMRWNKLDASGKPQQHPIDEVLRTVYQMAMCASEASLQ